MPVREAAPYYVNDRDLPAHVTILVPFVDPDAIDEAEVERLVSRFDAFDFTLTRIVHWPDLTVLMPEPSEPFSAMTRAVWKRWPEHPPYEGVHDEVIPHLTITEEDVPLPIAARAREVLLIEEVEPGSRWATRLRIPLG